MSNPVMALLEARRAELLGGADSVGVQEVRVAKLQADLAAAEGRLASCCSEVEEIDRVLALLTPDEPIEPEEPVGDDGEES